MASYSITDKCDGCDACRRACPAAAISGLQYKQHKIDPDLCFSCGLCAELCTNGAVLNEWGLPTEPRPREDWKTPIIDRAMCIGCSLCIENCPQFALELSDPDFHGNTHVYAELKYPERCTGCGKCTKHCGIGAIALGQAVIEETVKPVTFTEEDDFAAEEKSRLEALRESVHNLFTEKSGKI